MNAGDKLGHYTVVAKIGAGGMGEVYRATDTKLGRDVALKVLPLAFAQDAQRMQRFQREAQVLASLNHPNIATIHGLEESGATRALVMELVEGPTLAERIAQGALPPEEALPIAKQIVEALEYAHEHGVIHRDLKPANIKLTPEGQVKVLDFGLAKAMQDEPTSGLDLANSPTLSVAATKAGLILGTAAYMAPEQARGSTVDKRADVWSFGVVLFEMLSAQRPFAGETVSDTLAAVLRADPEWHALPVVTPPTLRRLLHRCLERDRKRRLRDIGEARIAIEDAIAHPEAEAEPKAEASLAALAQPLWRRALPWALVGILGAAAFAMGWRLLSLRPSATRVPVRFAITLPPNERLSIMYNVDSGVAVSPDGSLLAYTGVRDGETLLFLRRLDQLDTKPIPGTSNASNPFFSPDGKWLAFTANNRLMKVAVDGGSPFPICRADWGGGAWSSDGTIFFTPNYAKGLWRVSSDGGTPEKITEPNHEKGELGHWWPQLLPGGETILFTSFSTPISKARLMALTLATGEQKEILQAATYSRYLPTGHVIFMREEGLMAAPFDAQRLEVTGSSVRVLEDAWVDKQDGNSLLGISETGVMVYAPRSTLFQESSVLWVDRSGKPEAIPLPRNYYKQPRISPDGRKLALTTAREEFQDVWAFDLARRTMTSVAASPTSDFAPLWTADGKRILYVLERPWFDIAVRAADGTGQEHIVVTTPYDKTPHALTPDGKLLVYVEHHSETDEDIWTLPLEGAGKPILYLRTPFGEMQPALSPDGRWLAYSSNVSGREEIYVQAFPEPGERWQVSSSGGANPMWSRNGRELFFTNRDQMMAAPVETRSAFVAGKPALLFRSDFDLGYPGPSYDVAADGRFLMVRVPPEAAPRTLIVVVNWFEELKRLVPTGAK